MCLYSLTKTTLSERGVRASNEDGNDTTHKTKDPS